MAEAYVWSRPNGTIYFDKPPSQICYRQGIIAHTDDAHSIFILRWVDGVNMKVDWKHQVLWTLFILLAFIWEDHYVTHLVDSMNFET